MYKTMKKEFTKFELARLKRTAQNVDGYLKQKVKIEEQIKELTSKLEDINTQIDLMDAPTVAMTGYHTADIIKKVVVPTDKVNKDGNIQKKVTFEFIYPETIIPVVHIEETTEVEDNSVTEECDAEYCGNCQVPSSENDSEF